MKQNQNERVGYFPAKDEDINDKPEPIERHGRKRRSLNLGRLALLVCCAAVFAFCAVKLISYFGDILAAKSSTASLRAVYERAGDANTYSADTGGAGSDDAGLNTGDTSVNTTGSTSNPKIVSPDKTLGTDGENSAISLSAGLSDGVSADLQSQSPTLEPVYTPIPDAKELWLNYYPSNPRLTISSRFLDLLEKNKDIVGWLTIDGLVDEPVMQRDNEYYLTHNSSGKKSATGALFMDSGCNLRTADAQLVVHGHNMKEGAMFGSLKKYKVKDASYYKAHPFVTFNTLYEDGQYVIFAVLECDVRPGQYDYLPFWIKPTFASVQDFNDYISDARRLSHYNCNVDVRAGDRLLTLATCLGDDANKRLVIIARRVREGEDMLSLKTNILTSGNKP